MSLNNYTDWMTAVFITVATIGLTALLAAIIHNIWRDRF